MPHPADFGSGQDEALSPSKFDNDQSRSTSNKPELVEVELTTARNPLFPDVGVDETRTGVDGGEVEVDSHGAPIEDRPGWREQLQRAQGFVTEDTGWKKRLRVYIERKLFDPTVPREAQLFRKENVCIVLCYVVVGLFQGISSGVMNVRIFWI